MRALGAATAVRTDRQGMFLDISSLSLRLIVDRRDRDAARCTAGGEASHPVRRERRSPEKRSVPFATFLLTPFWRCSYSASTGSVDRDRQTLGPT
jgi:hypothetical protein